MTAFLLMRKKQDIPTDTKHWDNVVSTLIQSISQIFNVAGQQSHIGPTPTLIQRWDKNIQKETFNYYSCAVMI